MRILACEIVLSHLLFLLSLPSLSALLSLAAAPSSRPSLVVSRWPLRWVVCGFGAAALVRSLLLLFGAAGLRWVVALPRWLAVSVGVASVRLLLSRWPGCCAAACCLLAAVLLRWSLRRIMLTPPWGSGFFGFWSARALPVCLGSTLALC